MGALVPYANIVVVFLSPSCICQNFRGSKQNCVRCLNTAVAVGSQLFSSDRTINSMLRYECLEHC